MISNTDFPKVKIQNGMSEINWSESEKKAAQEAFKRAYEREINRLIQEVRQKAAEIAEIESVWQLHSFLSARRHEIDGKYDYRYLLSIWAGRLDLPMQKVTIQSSSESLPGCSKRDG